MNDRVDPESRNVLGGELMACSNQPLTGFFRNGCCETSAEDVGLHTVCAVMTAEFLEFSASVGNDLATPSPDKTQMKLLLRPPVLSGCKVAGRSGELAGRNLEHVQFVFVQDHIEVADLFPGVLPGRIGTVQVGAVFLPGGDLSGRGRHVEANLHHADHGVE